MTEEQLQRIFPDLDLGAFWDDSAYAESTYGNGARPTT